MTSGSYQEYFDRFKKQRQEISRLWNIGEETAELLAFLIKLQRPRNILEIGTSNGYSAFRLFLSAKEYGGSIDSLECERDRFELAEKNLSGLPDINLLFGKAEDLIPGLQNKYDFVFIDANKENYQIYLRLLQPKLNIPALIVADNIISHAHSIRQYLEEIAGNPDLTNITLPVGSGLSLSIYRPKTD